MITFAIQSAQNNANELENVLNQYSNEPQKLQATQFLLSNMLFHKGVDSTSIIAMQPYYDKYYAISEKHNWERSKAWRQEIDSFWKKEKNVLAFNKPDVEQIKADWLIREIDRSFKAWQENVYAKDCSFEDFCSYILPYRYSEGLCLDNSREVFYNRHAHIFNDPDKDFRAVTDSLHHLYSTITHNDWAAASMPIYSAATLEQIKRGSCDHKAWYNCLLMSALGMPVTIDFVPAWGNRSGAHSWNSLIVKGETHPFEPFWDEDRWKYKKIYNNECFDLKWGKFRLPKVFRHTFEYHLEGPLGDKSVNKDAIPPLFRNPLIKDVSDQYFQTVDVKINITETIPVETRYAYLCVFGEGKWHPVQWGKINRDGSVVFGKMGKDIVYLPMFYSNHELKPAGQAFLLNQKGEYEEMRCKDEKSTITVRNYTAYLFPEQITESKHFLSGSCLVGYNNITDSKGDTIYCMTDSMDTWENNIELKSPISYRYIRLMPKQDTVALCEISFFSTKNEGKRINDIQVTTTATSLNSAEKIEMIVDNLSATGFQCRFKNEIEKSNGILFDFGKPIPIQKIFYIPYTENYLIYTPEVELCYWDNKWISGGILKSDSNFVTFENIPKGTIYRVKKSNDRIFTYNDGIINWY